MAADQGQWPWEALPAAPSRRPSAEAAKRRRWEVGQQPLVLPTDSGDYVLLEVPSPRAAPAASSLPSPVVLSDGPPLVQRRPSSAPSEDPASGPSHLPRQHSPRARPASQEHAARARNVAVRRQQARPTPALQPEIRPLRPGAPAEGRWLASDLLHLPVHPVRLEARRAREDSVLRLRRAVQRADADLARALEQSAQEARAGRQAPRSAAEEEAQLAAAIQRSLQQRDGAEGPAPAVGAGAGGAAGSSAQHAADRAGAAPAPAAAAAAAPAPAPAPTPVPAPGPAARAPPTLWAEVGAAEKAELREEEERRQFEAAIAESLQQEEQKQADRRHEEDVQLLGFADSLREAGQRAGELAAAAVARPAAQREREAGRALALRLLEQQYASGSGMGSAVGVGNRVLAS